jgi:hypothetical protein
VIRLRAVWWAAGWLWRARRRCWRLRWARWEALAGWLLIRASTRVLRVTEDDDDGVIGVDEDRGMRTAPLGVVSGAVVGVVTLLSSR